MSSKPLEGGQRTVWEFEVIPFSVSKFLFKAFQDLLGEHYLSDWQSGHGGELFLCL